MKNPKIKISKELKAFISQLLLIKAFNKAFKKKKRDF